MFKVEAIKDDPKGRFKKGDVFTCYGFHWEVDLVGAYIRKEEDFFDMLFFLIWLPDEGWKFIEKCYFKPAGEEMNIPGICGETLEEG